MKRREKPQSGVEVPEKLVTDTAPSLPDVASVDVTPTRAVNKVLRALTGGTSTAEVMQLILDEVLESTGSEAAAIQFLELDKDGSLVIKDILDARRGGEQLSSEQKKALKNHRFVKGTLFNLTIKSEKPVVVNDRDRGIEKGVLDEGRIETLEGIYGRLDNTIAYPVFYEGRPIALIRAYNKNGDYDEKDVLALANLADSAAIALLNAEKNEKLETAIQDAREANEVTTRLTKILKEIMTVTDDPTKVLNKVLKSASDLLKVDKVAIRIIKPVGVDVHSTEAFTEEQRNAQRDRVSSQTPSRTMKELEEGAPFVIVDDAIESKYTDKEYAEKLGIASYVAAPLIDAYGEFSGDVRAYASKKRRFTVGEAELLASLANAAAIALNKAEEHAETVQEINEVAEFQEAIQPGTPLLKKASVAAKTTPRKVTAQTTPRKKTSGDLFDLIPVKMEDERCSVCDMIVGDVSGKGMRAAMYAIGMGTYLRGPIKGNAPSTVVGELNTLLTNLTRAYRDSFITMMYGRLDMDDMMLTFTSAGHEPPLLYRDGRVYGLSRGDDPLVELHVDDIGDLSREYELKANGLMLGIEEDTPYSETKVPLNSGDYLLFSTDGYTEARNNEREFFGIERLARAFKKHVEKGEDVPPGEVIDEIDSEVQALSFNYNDDRTLIAVKID